MLTDKDIIIDSSALIAETPAGQRYSVEYLVFVENNGLPFYQADYIKSVCITDDFKSLIRQSDTIECVNDDCSVVRFLDKDGNELETLSTTSELGSLLSSNVRRHYVKGSGPCTEENPCN